MTIEYPQRVYDLNGVRLMVKGDQQQIGFLDPILGPLLVTDQGSCDWAIELVAVNEVAPPPEAPRILWSGALPENLESICSESGGRRTLFVPSHFNMTNDIASQSSAIYFTPEGTKSIGGTGAFWLIGEILAAKERFLLHGACMVEPGSDTAIALFAPSGTGKTTTSLALANNGLALAGDDALVLEISGNVPYVWSIPRGLKVHQRTASLLPWLGSAIKEWDSDEQFIGLEELKNFICVASPARRRCAVVVILMASNSFGHEIKTMSKTDAVTYILSDNLRKGPDGLDTNGLATFGAVARLLAGAATVSLSVGPDPNSLHHSLIFQAVESITGDKQNSKLPTELNE